MNEKVQNSLKIKYKEKIKPSLKAALGKKNIYQVPAVEKIVVNTGFGRAAPDEKQREKIIESLTKITGQRPVFTKAKKAIASFKTRKGQLIGAKVTLRKNKMYDFLERLVSIVLPRLRDFRGISEKSFDGGGNYTLGFHEITVFPEIEYTKSEKPLGIQITIFTSATVDSEAKSLLSELGMPFRKVQEKRKVTAAL